MARRSQPATRGPRELEFMSRAWRGGCLGLTLLFGVFCAAVTVLAAVRGAIAATVLFAVFVVVVLWLADKVARENKVQIDGTVLSFKASLRSLRSCDLAQVTSARVRFSLAQASGGPGKNFGWFRECTLLLEGGGDLTSLALRVGWRWPRPEDLQTLIVALRTNPHGQAVQPAIDTMEQMARNRGRPPK